MKTHRRAAAVLLGAIAMSAVTAIAQAPRPVARSASQIDGLMGDASRFGWTRATAVQLQLRARDTEEQLQEARKRLIEESDRYTQAVADHNAKCKDRDWTQPTFLNCRESKERLDQWQQRSRADVAEYQRRNKENQDELALLKAEIAKTDRTIPSIDALLRNDAPFLTARPCVQPAAAAHLECLSAFWAQIDGATRLQLENTAYQYSLPASILVGGTPWTYGYYAPGANPALREGQEKNLRRQLSLGGLAPERFADRADYDMIVGVAESNGQFLDFLGRVVFGVSDAPQFSAVPKGTRAARLDCHSNGAMVCLEALVKGDIAADTVRLFGPQMTPPALARWRALLGARTIKSLEVHLMQGDPIPPASYDAGSSTTLVAAIALGTHVRARGAIWKLDAFKPDAAAHLKAQIQESAPAVSVNVIDDPACRQQLSIDAFACHDMALYQQRVRKN